MYAPIALFAYNRPDYLKQTLRALSQNVLAPKSPLIAFCDGPKRTASDDEKRRIQDVHDLLHQCSGFESVQINVRDENLGLANSIVAGVTAVVKEHGFVIVLE